MITIDEYGDMLERVCEELPEGIFDDLNLGVTISEELKIDPRSKNSELYIMGEYYYSGAMGSGIVMYYTPFAERYGELPEGKMLEKLREILKHELRHHIEYMAGDFELKEEEEEQLKERFEREKQNIDANRR